MENFMKSFEAKKKSSTNSAYFFQIPKIEERALTRERQLKL